MPLLRRVSGDEDRGGPFVVPPRWNPFPKADPSSDLRPRHIPDGGLDVRVLVTLESLRVLNHTKRTRLHLPR